MAELDPNLFTTSGSLTKKVYRDVYPLIDPSSPALSQKGKIVLITGASRGIGKLGFAAAFAKAQAKALILTARKVESLKSTEELVKSINPNIQILSVSLEVADEASVKKMFGEIRERFGHVDVVVNNAGTIDSGHESIAGGNVNLWWGDIEVNVKGQMLVARNFLQLLGTERKGTYIGLSSLAAFLVGQNASGYQISKLAGIQLAATIASEHPNVNAFALSPGIVATDMVDIVTDFKPFAKDTPDLSGGFAVWLATETAGFLSGRYLSVNWAVDELVAMKNEIAETDALKVKLGGKLGTATVAG